MSGLLVLDQREKRLSGSTRAGLPDFLSTYYVPGPVL